MKHAIEIEELGKKFPLTGGYRDVLTFWRRRYITALDGVSLRIPESEVFGIVGQNGAGKTTLLKILSGLIVADEGRLLVNGTDLTKAPDRLKNHITYVPSDERSLYWRLTGRENLKFSAILNNVPRREVRARTEEVLSAVDLGRAGDEMVAKYTSGMKQRLCLARGLITDAEILLMDEPTRSLDPISAKHIWTLVKDELVSGRKKTVIVTTHSMEEVTGVCNHVAIVHKGKVRFCDTVDNIVSRNGRYQIKIISDTKRNFDELRNLVGVDSVAVIHLNGGNSLSLEVAVQDPAEQIPLVLEYLTHAGEKVIEINQLKTSLSDTLSEIVEETQ